MGKTPQPLTQDEAIAIMNKMTSETEMAEQLTEFQKILTSNSQKLGFVSRNWWHGFRKRHASWIVPKKGEKFSLNLANWMKVSNIKQIYDYIYEEMIHAQIASPRENSVYMDCEGNEVEESERFGLVQEIKIVIQTISCLQMKVGVRQTRSRMEMLATENTSSNTIQDLKSSAALPTIGLLFCCLLQAQVKLYVACFSSSTKRKKFQ